jgi:membrane protease YdiL (CAAX protease family)
MNAYDVIPIEGTPEQVKKKIRACSNRNSFLLLLFIILGKLFGLSFNPLLKTLHGHVSAETLNSIATLLGYGFQYLAIVPIVLLVGNYNNQHKVKTYFNKPQQPKKFIFKWTIITMGIAYATNYIFTIIFAIIQAILDKQFNAPSFIAEDNLFNRIVMFTAMAVLAPIFEELMFRGTTLTHTIKYGKWLAIIVTGCSFGLLHQNYQQIFYATVMGIAVSFIAVKTKSIIPAIIVHFSLNFMSAIQSMFLVGLDIDSLKKANATEIIEFFKSNIVQMTGVISIGMICLGLSIAGIILMVIEIVKNKKVFVLEETCIQLTSKQKALAYITAPLTIIALLYLIVITVLRAI